MIKLNIGTVLFYKDYKGNLNKLIITRTTKTQAIADVKDGEKIIYSRRFNLEQHDFNFFSEKGSSSYNKTYYSVATTELYNEYQRQKLEKKVSAIDIKKLSNKQLIDILEICKKEEKCLK